MAHPATTARMTYGEYLAAEEVSEIRREFLNGEVCAMSGGTLEQLALAAAVIQALGNALRGKPCRVFTSDLRVRVADTGLSTYPDVTIVCDQVETAPEDADAVTNPRRARRDPIGLHGGRRSRRDVRALSAPAVAPGVRAGVAGGAAH